MTFIVNKLLDIMKIQFSILLIFLFFAAFIGCSEKNQTAISRSAKLSKLFTDYWEERLQLFPLEATAIGDTRYNDRLPIVISDSYREKTKQFYQKYKTAMESLNDPLHQEDALSKEIFLYEMNANLSTLNYPTHWMPINQFWSFTLDFAQLGSGDGNQPFKTVKDYDDFLARMKAFPAWVDTAITNMKTGIANTYTIPKVLAEKVVPQLKNILTIDPTKNIFYSPILKMPSTFPSEDRKRLENAYFFQIANAIIPSYSKLKKFFEKEYIPACRNTHGYSALPNGNALYQACITQFTTTTLTPDSIYNTGLREVARLRKEMEKVKTQVGYTGNLSEFFNAVNKDKQFMPFTSEQEVLDSFKAIQSIQEPKLSNYFETFPKTPFEIRQTEAYRAATASAEYNAGSADGKRPGIFYVPILHANTFNVVGMETLFLHEAIPGHHFQISLQQENKELPAFRKFLGYSAYAEGWALYTETLGKELGLFTNPYQYLGHLSDAMHRAIRLVVDVAIHTKGMHREEAIAYMMQNERISEQEATAEIERYMAIPGQALSYKIGQFSIEKMKQHCMKKLGNRFDIKKFHTQLLEGGNMSLQVLEKKLVDWAERY